MIVVIIICAVAYALIWRIPRFGKRIALILMFLQILVYAYAIPTKWYYVELVERNSGVEFVGDVEVRWGWASPPFAFPNVYADRAIDVLIVSDEINVESAREDLKHSSSLCKIASTKARTLYGGGAMDHCWSGLSSSGRDDVYIAVSTDYKTLYFRQR